MPLENRMVAVVLMATRVGSLLTFAPVLGGKSVPMRVKAGLTVLVTALLFPEQHHLLTQPGFPQALAGELSIGLVLGLMVSLVFEAAQMAGQVAGFQLGFSLVNVIDPQTRDETTAMTVFHQILTMLIFLQLNVHHWLLRGIAKSFEYVPVGTALAHATAARGLLEAAGGIWLAGLQIAAPVLIATMLADFAAGMLGKTSPQLPLLFLEIPAKTVIGLLAIGGSLMYWPSMFERYFRIAVAASERVLGIGS